MEYFAPYCLSFGKNRQILKIKIENLPTWFYLDLRGGGHFFNTSFFNFLAKFYKLVAI
jgi:hypothetical protein